MFQGTAERGSSGIQFAQLPEQFSSRQRRNQARNRQRDARAYFTINNTDKTTSDTRQRLRSREHITITRARNNNIMSIMSDTGGNGSTRETKAFDQTKANA